MQQVLIYNRPMDRPWDVDTYPKLRILTPQFFFAEPKNTPAILVTGSNPSIEGSKVS